MPSSSFRKICPKCRKSDLTDLPKCRFCDTPYLAVLQGNKLPNSNDKTLFVIMGCVILLIVGFGASRSLNEQQEKKLAPLISAIKAANRPRLVEFYATWCGPCQMSISPRALLWVRISEYPPFRAHLFSTDRASRYLTVKVLSAPKNWIAPYRFWPGKHGSRQFLANSK
jgi:thiol-disulfide isomerase/thioredoxin